VALGGNSQYEAIYRRPDLFENVACMCSPMVVSMAAIYSTMSELQGISQYQELIDLELLKMGRNVGPNSLHPPAPPGEGVEKDREGPLC
jgi:hypothetical protein